MAQMLRACLIVLALGAIALPATSQDIGRPNSPAIGLQLSRDTLQKLLASYDATARSPLYSRQLKERARQEAELIRTRLETGDIQVGDKIYLLVERQPELSDTFNVQTGPKIVLAEIGDVPLQGVLRSELQQYLHQHLSKFIVNPTVQASSLVRLELTGTVGRPGFYTLPSDMPLSDVLMEAGGPGQNAALNKLSVRRRNDRIWEGESLRTAMVEGRTVDQLSLRAGDEINVPMKRNTMDTIRSVWYVFPLVSLIVTLTR
jgi:protein involved in polysaccharide export with SLBB domain